MRFWIEANERLTRDPQERVAMLRIRIASIDYHMDLLKNGGLRYVYKSVDGINTFMAAESESFTDLDRQIKKDPLFGYASFKTLPLIPVDHLVNEIQEYLDEEIMTKEEIENIAEPDHPPIRQPGEKLFLATKVVPPFSSLLEEGVQRDIARRTILAQQYHWGVLELHDENPVGQSVGLLVAKARQIEDIRKHVADCEVYPDTEVSILELHSLEESREQAREQLRSLWRDPDAKAKFRGL